MWTLVFALLAALLFAQRFEGSIRVRCVWASCTFVAFGRVRLHARTWRPGRLYLRVEVI